MGMAKMNSKTRFSILQAILGTAMLLLAVESAAWGQAGRGGINGFVSDPAGAIVSGASVTITNNATGIAQSTVTTAAGLYSFVSLAPGSYQVTASRDGFETVKRAKVAVSVDQVSTVNIALRVGSVNEVVTVTGTADLGENTNSTVGQLIDAEVIDRVPLLTRDVYDLVQLSAGVLPTNGTPNAADTPSINGARTGVDVSAFTINGSLQGSVYYMLDGSPIGIAENNTASIIPAMQVPEDGIDEYRLETQNAPANYQSGGAGVISLVTKSGGSQFHGDAFGYFRPNVLAANDYFNKQSQLSSGAANQAPAFYRYQEGASIGGPILHKKLFFFADYEATQQKLFESGTFTVPTAAELTGDFSADASNFTVYNPLVPDNADGTRQAFSGNKIPAADQDPVARNFISQFPLPAPNSPGVGPYHVNNYFNSGLDPTTAQKFDIRGDYYLSEKQRIFSRFSFDRGFASNADLYGSGLLDPFFFQNITNARNILLADDYTLSPTSMLQLRYSFTRHYENQTGDPSQNGFDITKLGFPQSLAQEVLYHQVPTILFSTVSAMGGTTNDNTFIFASENSDASATYTKALGKHELSIGFEYMKKFMNVGQPGEPAGSYNFDNTATSSTTFAGDGSDFASFLLGMGSAPGDEGGNFTEDLFAAEANNYYGAFAQDNFHITPKLTVNLGVRWDIFGGRTERHNRLEYFDPNLQFTADGVPLSGGEVFMNGGNRSPFTTNMKNIGPRAGFSWQSSKNMVFRGGASIYYGPSTEMVANSGQDSDGFSSSSAWNATNYNADGNTVINAPVSNPFPQGIVISTGSSLGSETYLGSTLTSVTHSPRTVTTYDFNFGFQYEFPHQTILSAAYVGSRGLFLPLGSADLNQLSLGTMQKYGTSLCVVPDATCSMVPNVWEATQPNTNANFGSSTVPLWVALQPFPQFGTGNFGAGNGINMNGFPGGDSEYSSLQAKVEKHMTHYFTTLASFTWGKLMTDDSGAPLSFIGYHSGAPQDFKNLNLEHSLSPQDVKLQFNWQVSYDLPIGQGRALNLHGVANQALGGWTVNTIVYRSTGVPIAAPTGTGDPYFLQRVNQNCNPGQGAPHSTTEWFNYTCFSTPVNPFAPGTASAYLSGIRTAGAHDLDLSLYKSFHLWKEANVRFEASAYNLTNSVQFGYPNVFWFPTPTPSNMAGFGQITGDVNSPRQLQFGSKFTF
jgi:Carboxypeptidase regulatory-like domain